MTHNNIDLSLRVFNSDLKFIVSDDEIKLVLDKDLKLRLNFDTNSNTITLGNPSKYDDEVLENVVEEVKEIENNQNGSDINVATIEEPIIEDVDEEPTIEEPTREDKVEETKDETYWDNGILKHKQIEEPQVVEDNTYVPIEVSNLPKSSKRGRPHKIVICYNCGGQVEKERYNGIKVNDHLICSKCAIKLREQLKRDVLRLQNKEE